MIKPRAVRRQCCPLHHRAIWIPFSHQPVMDTIATKCSFMFFSWIVFFQFLLSLSADGLCEALGLLRRFYDSIAFLAWALAHMTHESAWCWLWVGVSSLELAWVVPHLHLFLSHVMPSSREAFPCFSTLPIWFHPNVSQLLLKSAKRTLCGSTYQLPN